MLSVHPDGCVYVSAVITEDDDERCGQCFAPGCVPLGPDHCYNAHLSVRLSSERFDLITDRYVGWWSNSDLPADGWKAPMEQVVALLEGVGYRVLAQRRIRFTPRSLGTESMSMVEYTS